MWAVRGVSRLITSAQYVDVDAVLRGPASRYLRGVSSCASGVLSFVILNFIEKVIETSPK
jgi:hypothetical protein